MLRAAAGGLGWAQISDWELTQKSGPSYSWKTVEHFRAEAAVPAEWFWLMGWDQWNVLERWNRWEYLASMVTFLVFGRDGAAPLERPGVRAKFLTGQFHGSSTEARTKVAQGGSITELVPAEVRAIIRRDRLYLTPPSQAMI